jgi:hypothetical protein
MKSKTEHIPSSTIEREVPGGIFFSLKFGRDNWTSTKRKKASAAHQLENKRFLAGLSPPTMECSQFKQSAAQS